MTKRSKSKNTTIENLKHTPFSTATERKKEEDRITREEWEKVERARIRYNLLRKPEYAPMLTPFTNGFGSRYAPFPIMEGNIENLVKVYLNKKEELQIDVNESLDTEDASETTITLVRSVCESFMGSYYSVLGLGKSSKENSEIKFLGEA